MKLTLKLARASTKCYEFYNYITIALVKMMMKCVRASQRYHIEIRQLTASTLKNNTEVKCGIFEPSRFLVGKSPQFQMFYPTSMPPASFLGLFPAFIFSELLRKKKEYCSNSLRKESSEIFCWCSF